MRNLFLGALAGLAAIFVVNYVFLGDDPAPELEAERNALGQEESRQGFIYPTFDVVRLDPEGTAVFAGRAAPYSDVEILDNQKTLMRAKAVGDGSWTAILDEPLEPGALNLRLRSTLPDETIFFSKQFVTISVPERKKESPMIVLSQPGKG